MQQYVEKCTHALVVGLCLMCHAKNGAHKADCTPLLDYTYLTQSLLSSVIIKQYGGCLFVMTLLGAVLATQCGGTLLSPHF